MYRFLRGLNALANLFQVLHTAIAKTANRRQAACSQFTIQGIPKRSVSIPKPGDQKVDANRLNVAKGPAGRRDAFEEMQNALLDGLAFVIARVRHQKFSADGDGAL